MGLTYLWDGTDVEPDRSVSISRDATGPENDYPGLRFISGKVQRLVPQARTGAKLRKPEAMKSASGVGGFGEAAPGPTGSAATLSIGYKFDRRATRRRCRGTICDQPRKVGAVPATRNRRRRRVAILSEAGHCRSRRGLNEATECARQEWDSLG